MTLNFRLILFDENFIVDMKAYRLIVYVEM